MDLADHRDVLALRTPDHNVLKKVSLLCFTISVLITPWLRADVTLMTTFESGDSTGVDVLGSNQWWIHGSRARWDLQMDAKDRRPSFPMNLHDRSCLMADLHKEVIKELDSETGQFSEIPFREWKAHADTRDEEDNPFLNPATTQSAVTHGRFRILPSTETARIGGWSCQKIAYEVSYDSKEPGFRTQKHCRILTTFWLADATPESARIQTEVDGFFDIFEQKTGDRARFSNPFTLGSHVWAEGSRGTSDVAGLMAQLEAEVRKLHGIPVKIEMETTLDAQPLFWFWSELKTLSSADVPTDLFNSNSAEPLLK